MKNNNTLIPRSEQIEVEVLDASQQKFSIQRQPKLDGMFITSIQLYKASEMTETPLGRTVVPDAVFQKSFVTLESYSGRENFDNVPASRLSTEVNAGISYDITPQRINFENSFIELPSTAGLVVGQAWLMTVTYFDPQLLPKNNPFHRTYIPV